MGFGYEEAKRKDPRPGFVTWGAYGRETDSQEIYVGLELIGVVESDDVARRIVWDLRALEAKLSEWQDSEWDRSNFEDAVHQTLLKHSPMYRVALNAEED